MFNDVNGDLGGVPVWVALIALVLCVIALGYAVSFLLGLVSRD